MKNKLLIVSVLSISIILTSCSGNNNELQEDIETGTAVEVTAATSSSIENQLGYAGRVEASETVLVASKISSKVASTHFEVGDTVNEGDVMLRLDEQSIKDQIRTLESQLAISNQAVISAQNSVNSVTGGQFTSQVQQLETAVTNARNQVESAELAHNNAKIALTTATEGLTNAQNTYNNTKILFDAGAVTKNQLESAELALTQARASVEQAQIGVNQAELTYNQATTALNSAQTNLELNTGTIVNENIANASLAVDQAIASRNSTQVQLDIARSSLNDTSVRAPISGVVSAKNAIVGEFTSTQTPAYTIINMDNIHVLVNISEVLINRINTGDEVDVYINTVRPEPFTGKIISISPSADQSSTFPVKIELENSNHVLRPGMFAEINFIKEASSNAIVVPRNTVLNDNNGTYVYINENSTAKRVDVTTGIDNGVNIEILTGINLGDEIITNGQTFITNGDMINVVSSGGN